MKPIKFNELTTTGIFCLYFVQVTNQKTLYICKVKNIPNKVSSTISIVPYFANSRTIAKDFIDVVNCDIEHTILESKLPSFNIQFHKDKLGMDDIAFAFELEDDEIYSHIVPMFI